MDSRRGGSQRGGVPERRHFYKVKSFFQKQGFPSFGSLAFDRLCLAEILKRQFQRTRKTNLMVVRNISAGGIPREARPQGVVSIRH